MLTATSNVMNALKQFAKTVLTSTKKAGQSSALYVYNKVRSLGSPVRVASQATLSRAPKLELDKEHT